MSRNLHAEAFGVHPTLTHAGRDEKAWAKRIVWRQENGDRDLMPIQIQFARQALDIKPEAA